MATFDITCADVRHALRSALPGWRAVLGTSSAPAVAGHLCDACAKGRETDASDNAASVATRILFEQDAAVSVTVEVPRTYVDGSIVGVKRRKGTLNQAVAVNIITSAERTSLLAILAKLRDGVIALPE